MLARHRPGAVTGAGLNAIIPQTLEARVGA
jgi:hypothetical protein